jgi:selenocysteine lyase/cysteine desulfurase
MRTTQEPRTTLGDEVLGSFPDVRGHLDAATCGVPPLAAAAAMRAAVAEWAEGRLCGVGYDESVERSRTAFARIVGVHPNDVAQGSQVSVFVGLIAAALPRGARVLTASGDFTSLTFPMLAQRERGVEVREAPLEALIDAIDPRTELVAVSAVQSADGRVIDLEALAAAADANGARVLLDATQACGWLPIEASRFSYVVAGAYKWLCSPRGTAFIAVRPEALDAVTPHAAGWYAADHPWEACYGSPLRLSQTARRLDVSPAWACAAGTAPALELLAEIGVAAVNDHDVGLANRLRTGLGLEPSDSAIVSCDIPGGAERLERAGVKASVRDGRVRLACHLPATTADVDRCLEALGPPAGASS